MNDRLAPLPARDDVVLLLAAVLVPWTIVHSGGAVSLVFPWGLVGAWPPPVTAVPLWRYLLALTAGLPFYLQAWPLSVVVYAGALASAAAPRSWGFDETATAALLGVAAASHLLVSVGVWRTGRIALPVGAVLLGVLALVVHRGWASRGG